MATVRISSIRGTGEGGGVPTSLVGPTSVLEGSVNTYTITDYDDFSIYEVSSDIGSVTQTGETITLTVPQGATGESISLAVSRSGSTRVFQIALGGTGIVTPAIISPPNGSGGAPTTLTIQATAFATVPAGSGLFQSSQWQVARDAGFTDIVSSGTVSSGNMTRYTVTNLSRNTTFFARVKYISDIGESGWSATVNFTTVNQQISQPTLTIAGGTSNVQETPTFNSSAFATIPEGSDTHVASSWVIRNADTENIVWQLNHSTSNKLSITLPLGVLNPNTAYTAEVQYIGGFGSSPFSEKLFFTTAESFIPEVPGTPFGGGYYVGQMDYGAQKYAIVVAPKSQGGEFGPAAWGTHPGAGEGSYPLPPLSPLDGYQNTQNIVNSDLVTCPGAEYCNSLTINGYNDWYMPSPYELNLLYWMLKPTNQPNKTTSDRALEDNPFADPPLSGVTTVYPERSASPLFRGGAESFTADTMVPYWSSMCTRPPATGFRAHSIRFSDGDTGYESASNNGRVRAIRRVPIPS